MCPACADSNFKLCWGAWSAYGLWPIAWPEARSARRPLRAPKELSAAVGAAGGYADIKRASGINTKEDFALLAQAPRQGIVNLGVGAGRAHSSALGAAEAEAAEVAVYLGTRERLGHKVCWVLCAQHLM
jgi:hypothetical protein